jgi:hypothetical protein
VQTRSGNVELRIPDSAAFDLSIDTRSGFIQTSRTIEASGTFARNRFEGRIRGGGTRIGVDTRSGSIRIR